MEKCIQLFDCFSVTIISNYAELYYVSTLNLLTLATMPC